MTWLTDTRSAAARVGAPLFSSGINVIADELIEYSNESTTGGFTECCRD
jgi:hypothetical protein